MNTPEYIIIHTAAFDGPATPHDIDDWHAARGFVRYTQDWPPEDVHRANFDDFMAFGYHYYVRTDGECFKIRHHLERGSHCRDQGMNRRSIGICFEGHGDLYDFSANQYKAGALLCRSIIAEFPLIRIRGPYAILGHREVHGVSKTCPGTSVDMDMVRALFFQP